MQLILLIPLCNADTYIYICITKELENYKEPTAAIERKKHVRAAQQQR